MGQMPHCRSFSVELDVSILSVCSRELETAPLNALTCLIRSISTPLTVPENSNPTSRPKSGGKHRVVFKKKEKSKVKVKVVAEFRQSRDLLDTPGQESSRA